MITAPTYNIPQVPSSFPCPPGDLFSLPTRADLINLMNEIGKIPGEITAFILEQGEKLTEEAIQSLRDLIDEIRNFMDKLADLLSPYWQKLSVRNWQKEAADAVTKLIQEFHNYIPAKIVELIGKLIPVNLTIPIPPFGINVNIVKIFTKEEQLRIQKQIAENLDEWFSLLPEAFQGFSAKFGVLCDEWKAQMTWQYIRSKIQALLTGPEGLMGYFNDLIGIFKDIWKLLDLPSLPFADITKFLNFNVSDWISSAIGSLKKQRDKLLDEMFDAVGEAREKIRAKVKEVEDAIRDVLDNLNLLGIANIRTIIGGKIERTTRMIEEEIAEIALAFEDFKNNWAKKLLFDWVKIIKKFLNMIGLGKLFEFVFFTFCDLLKLIGFPFSINLSNATAAVAVSEFTKGSESLEFDDVIVGDGSSDTFAPTGSGANLYVFLDGVKTEAYTLQPITGNVIFNTPPAEGVNIFVIKSDTDLDDT